MMKKTKLKLLLVTSLSLTILSFLISSVKSEQIEINNNVFSPLYVGQIKYDICDQNGLLLTTIDGTTGSVVWRDATHKYPVIDIIRSDPFLVDQSGLVITDPNTEMVNPNTLEIKGAGSNLIYLKKFYVAIDVAIRTYTNMPALNYYTIPISPLNNVYHSHAGRTDYNAFSSNGGSGEKNAESDWNKFWNAGIYDYQSTSGTYTNIFPYGVILAKCGTGGNPWGIEWYLKDVAIKNSLENINVNENFLQGGSATENDLSTALNNLDNNYGNSKVIVRPNITINSIPNLIKYDYYKTLDNGTKIHVYTTSSKMGFFNVKPVTGLQRFGLVKNTITEDMASLGLKATPKEDEVIVESPKGRDDLPSDKQAYIVERSYDGHFTYTKTEPMTLNGGARIYSQIKTNIVPQAIDINNFNLPNKAWVALESELEPLTTASIANYELKYLGWFVDGTWPDTEDSVYSATKTIKFPYKIGITNVYAVQRFVFETAVLTNNKMEIIPVEGKPIEVTDIEDHEITDQGGIPGYNDVTGSVTERSFDWAAWLKDAFTGGLSFITWIVIGIIAIAAIVIVSKLAPSRKS